jgi:pilus assembly protein Flp/PilA
MMNLLNLVTIFTARFRSEEGQTMAEYGILIAVIAIIVVGAAAILGTQITGVFNSTSGKL